MKPYYSESGIEIYLGDCREILPQLKFDAVVSDPPYGISWTGPRMRRETVVGDDAEFDPTQLLGFDVPMILWGANNYAMRLPHSQNWLVWIKRAIEVCATKDHGDCELAWTRGVINGGVKAKRFIWDGNIRQLDEEMARLHPAQKPLAIMSWCVSLTTAQCICDPYMGSGTTLKAAKDLSRRAIGIEIEEKYCEIAAKRLSQSVFQFSPESETEPELQQSLLGPDEEKKRN